MAVEPMIKEARRVYKESNVFKLDQLLKEQTRWTRKRTIAENKLADVRRRIDQYARELADPKAQAQ